MFEWSNSYWTHTTRTYYTYVYVPFVTFGYFYGTYLDIVITVDRIENFNKKLKDLMKLSAYKMCIVGFFLCFLVDLPYCFAFVPASITTDVFFSDGRMLRGYQIWFAGVSDFASSQVNRSVRGLRLQRPVLYDIGHCSEPGVNVLPEEIFWEKEWTISEQK